MAKITVTIPPEMRSISGFLFEKDITSLISFSSYDGNIILGLDNKKFPVRIGPKPPRVFVDPYILISEDLQYLFASEGSIFSDSLTINATLKFDGSGQTFPLDSEGKPILDLSYDTNNWPDFLISPTLVEINKNSPIALFDINAPRRSTFSYSFSDLTTKFIRNKVSYYSVDLGNTWNAYSGPFITPELFGYGRVLIYIDISGESSPTLDDLIFLLKVNISDDITYLTAEYGETPTSSSKGTIIGIDLLQINNYLTLTRGRQEGPKPYGSFKSCLDNKGLTELYGESTVTVINGTPTYSYKTFKSFSNRCIK